jgi:uncharacterized membrane protein YhaH (DUF805 family)
VIVLLFVFLMMLPIITRETVPPSFADPKKLNKSQKIVVYVALVALFLALLAPLIAFTLFGLIDLYTNTPEALVIIVVAAGCSIGFFLTPPRLRRTVIISISMLMSLTVSFVFGFTSGRTYFGAESPNIIKLKSGPPISGRIIRSGERGVLFYDPAEKKIRFELWDAISSIELPAERRTP